MLWVGEKGECRRIRIQALESMKDAFGAAVLDEVVMDEGYLQASSLHGSIVRSVLGIEEILSIRGEEPTFMILL